MKNLSDNKIWRPYDKAGTLLFTKIPNCLIKNIVSGKYARNEIKIMLYFCRMSYGFKKEETRYLNNEEISLETGIASSHVSENITRLINSQTVFRNNKNGNKYKYAINLLFDGIEMKHYRSCEENDKLSSEECVYSNVKYRNSSSNEEKNHVIVYNSRGYGNQENSYINNNRNLEINKDTSFRTTTFESSDTGISNFLCYFEEEIKKHNTLDNIKLFMAQYFTLLKKYSGSIKKFRYDLKMTYENTCVYLPANNKDGYIELHDNRALFNQAEKELNYSGVFEAINNQKTK